MDGKQECFFDLLFIDSYGIIHFFQLFKERRWGRIEKTYNDDESEKDIQKFVDDFINEKGDEIKKDEFETILHGVTGKEMRWAIYSAISKQKEKQRCQEQKISSLQIAVILQGIAVIILGIGGIILKKYLPWQRLLQQSKKE